MTWTIQRHSNAHHCMWVGDVSKLHGEMARNQLTAAIQSLVQLQLNDHDTLMKFHVLDTTRW